MSHHSPIAQDILSHLALRGAGAGTAFDWRDFWPLASARGDVDVSDVEAALEELTADGCLVGLDGDYHLTNKGFEHVHGRPETTGERDAEIQRRDQSRGG